MNADRYNLLQIGVYYSTTCLLTMKSGLQPAQKDKLTNPKNLLIPVNLY